MENPARIVVRGDVGSLEELSLATFDNWRPIVLVGLKRLDGQVEGFRMLLDTGADQVVVGLELGNHLGFTPPVSTESPQRVRVAGDTFVLAYQRYPELHLLNHLFVAPVWWLTVEQRMPLLGRRGFLRHFDVQIIEPIIHLRWRGSRWYPLQCALNLGWQPAPQPEAFA